MFAEIVATKGPRKKHTFNARMSVPQQNQRRRGKIAAEAL
jgi:hypothetical protein